MIILQLKQNYVHINIKKKVFAYIVDHTITKFSIMY